MSLARAPLRVGGGLSRRIVGALLHADPNGVAGGSHRALSITAPFTPAPRWPRHHDHAMIPGTRPSAAAVTVAPDYGIDAPGVRRGMITAAATGAMIAAGSMTLADAGTVRSGATSLGALVAAYGVGMASCMTWGSRVGKRRTRERLLDRVGAMLPGGRWSGAEQVLDVGCGRGLMLVGAAQRLITGLAVGVDLWRESDQTGNTPAAALENARREGVTARVRVDTGDARALPFPDASADVVVSHWVVHNLDDASDRKRALDEMWRVLRPGGVIALADIAHVSSYERHFSALGADGLWMDDGGWEARIMGALSGGSYRPQALLARRKG